MNAPWARRLSALHRDQRGQAMLLGVFYFLLLAALVFLVINSGKKANSKITMQNTADATAATSATWIARGLNTISMCNVTQTQLMSVIVLLDSMETVAPVGQRIIDDLLSNIGASTHGSDVANDPQLSEWLIVNNASVEQQMMLRLNRLIQSIPMEHYCTYDSGVLWQCCYVLNEMKVQIAAIAPEKADRESFRISLEGKGAETADASFCLPFYPQLPIEEPDMSGRSFRLFRNPMERGRRVYDRRASIGGYRHLQGYASRRNGRTMGPFGYMREPFVEPTPMGLFELSRFSVLFKTVSDKKLNMLFGSANEKACLLPENRIEDYDELVDFVNENGRDAVIHTYWTSQGFASRDEYNTPGFRNQMDLRHHQYPRERLRVYSGFRAAPNGYTRATTAGEGADARHDLWYRSQERQTAHYPQLGIYAPHSPFHEDGSRWEYTEGEMETYFRNSLWRFDGADVGEEQELHRRYLPPVGQPPLMAPIVLNRTTGKKTDTNIFDHFTFVGFATTDARSLAAPGWFPNPVPTDDRLVCYAQAEIFNDTGASGRRSSSGGWDLFTQNWRVRLVRMDHWDWSKDAIDAGIPSEAQFAAENITSVLVLPVRKMLEMYDPEFVDLITH